MTTRAEEIAGEGPYKVIQLTDRLVPTFVLTGPHHVAAFWATRHDAKAEADRLNAAYKQGQQDAQPSQTEDLDAMARKFTDELCAFLNQHPTDAALKNKLIGFSTGLFMKRARSIAHPSAHTLDVEELMLLINQNLFLGPDNMRDMLRRYVTRDKSVVQ